MRKILVLQAGLLLVAGACGQKVPPKSEYPVAVDLDKVGDYPAVAASGGGYFYDDVLEYRVWVHPSAGGDDWHRAFAAFEQAEAFSKKTLGAEAPLVLVRQLEWVDEPVPDLLIPMRNERIAEWQVEWLKDNKRQPESIESLQKERKYLQDINFLVALHLKAHGAAVEKAARGEWRQKFIKLISSLRGNDVVLRQMIDRAAHSAFRSDLIWCLQELSGIPLGVTEGADLSVEEDAVALRRFDEAKTASSSGGGD